jgi:hypothetical protein
VYVRSRQQAVTAVMQLVAAAAGGSVPASALQERRVLECAHLRSDRRGTVLCVLRLPA